MILQAFALCQAGDFNLSYESLTSFAVREKLRNFKTTDPDFWAELSQGTASQVDEGNQTLLEDEIDEEPGFDGVVNLPCNAVIPAPSHIKLTDEGYPRLRRNHSAMMQSYQMVPFCPKMSIQRKNWVQGSGREQLTNYIIQRHFDIMMMMMMELRCLRQI